MAKSSWKWLALALVALACDQNVPSGPSLTPVGLRPMATPQVTASEVTGTITISGSDGYPGEQISLTPYDYNVVAKITLSGAAHFAGDTLYTPGHLASGDIGPAGILVGTNCRLQAAVAFRTGFLAPGPCAGAPGGSQSFDTTELIAGTPMFGVGSAASTRNFCGPTTICVTWSGSEQVVIQPLPATLMLSVDPTVADSGTVVTARAVINPPTLAGIPVPVPILEWQLPDPAQGCASNSRTCTFTATRSGDITVSAIVNGTTQTSAASLTVLPPPDTTHQDSTGSDSTGPCLAPRRGIPARSVPGLKTATPALMRSGCGGGGGPKATVRLEYPAGTPILQGGMPLILPAGIRRSDVQYDTTAGRPPYLGGVIWPDSLVIIAHLDTAGATPELFSRAIMLRVESIDSDGRSIDSTFGHAHPGSQGPKPAGTLRQGVVESGLDSSDATVFVPSGVSGPVILRGTAPNADPFVDTIWVGVPGLVRVEPSATYDTTGGTDAHPFGHNVWVRPEMLDTLARFAGTIDAVLGIRSVFNDASLPYGGKFDLHRQWDSPDPGCSFTKIEHGTDTIVVANSGGCHQTHRTGWDVDLRTRGILNADDVDLAVQIWEALSCSKAYFEGDHVHLALREGGHLYLRRLPGC